MLEEKDDLGRTPLCHALLIDNGVYVFEELLLGGCNINGKMVNEKTLISHIIENSMSEHLALALKVFSIIIFFSYVFTFCLYLKFYRK